MKDKQLAKTIIETGKSLLKHPLGAQVVTYLAEEGIQKLRKLKTKATRNAIHSK